MIEVEDERSSQIKTVVRGFRSCEYHKDIMNMFEQEVRGIEDVYCSSPGGGRIHHDPEEKYVKIYGYSVAYGQGDHEKTKKIME